MSGHMCGLNYFEGSRFNLRQTTPGGNACPTTLFLKCGARGAPLALAGVRSLGSAEPSSSPEVCPIVSISRCVRTVRPQTAEECK